MLHNMQLGITVTLGGQEQGLPSLMTNTYLDSQQAPEHGQKRWKFSTWYIHISISWIQLRQFIVIHKQLKFKESKGQIDLWIKPNQIYVYLVSGPVYHVYPTRYDTFLVFWLWCIEVVLQAAARGWLEWWRHTKVGAGPVPLSCLTSRSQDRDQALWRRNLEMMGKVARCPGSSTASGGTTTTTYTLQLLHWYLSHYFSFPLNYSI